MCSRNDEGVKQNVGDRDKAINGLSPRNRWTDGEDKLRAGAIFENIC